MNERGAPKAAVRAARWSLPLPVVQPLVSTLLTGSTLLSVGWDSHYHTKQGAHPGFFAYSESPLPKCRGRKRAGKRDRQTERQNLSGPAWPLVLFLLTQVSTSCPSGGIK